MKKVRVRLNTRICRLFSLRSALTVKTFVAFYTNVQRFILKLLFFSRSKCFTISGRRFEEPSLLASNRHRRLAGEERGRPGDDCDLARRGQEPRSEHQTRAAESSGWQRRGKHIYEPRRNSCGFCKPNRKRVFASC